MRILIAPDSFKQSLTAVRAAAAMARGVRAARPDATIDLCPMADGGEGTADTLIEATGGQRRTAIVTGPLGEPVEAIWGLLGDGRTAVIEMAQAAGLMRVPPDRRDPTRTTTRGVGELMHHALDAGAKALLVAIGGSATTDAGLGMAQALGVRFLDDAGRLLGEFEPLAGRHLGCVAKVDLTRRDARLNAVRVEVACDVTNPLFGPTGAAHVYGPQKGATPEQVRQLDGGLRHLATVVNWVSATTPGSGAAGGLGFGLMAFCDATLRRGVELVLDAVRFGERVRLADLVLTGEGRLDRQSLSGKTCIGVAQAACKHGVPTIALVGSASDDADEALRHGLHAWHAIVDATVTIEQAMRQAEPLLEQLAAKVVSGASR